MRSGIAALRAKLRGLPTISMSAQKRDAKFDYYQLSGYRVSTPEENRYVIKVESYKQIFSTNEQRVLVTNWLTEKSRITLGMAKTAGSSSERKLKDQFIWPDGKRRRSIEIVWKKKTEKKSKPKRHARGKRAK